MAAWIWIVIALAALIAVAGALIMGRQAREKRLDERRNEAQKLRRQAEERETIARGHEAQAQEKRREAAEVGARADRVDPDREDG